MASRHDRSARRASANRFGGAASPLQIAYLPHLYAAFNRRENEIALLNSRAGMPS
jgi:hypothetical protein